jgi:putative copper export protein/mono/diheme cytochrome c family protein
MVDAASIMAGMRGLHLAATVSLLGTVAFVAWILPAAGSVPTELRRRLIHVWWVSGTVALLAGLAWFTLQAAAIDGASTVAETWAALPLVAAHTRYGSILMVRLGLLLVATALGLAGRGVVFAVVSVAVALGLQGMIGHAGATDGNSLVLSEALHLLAAGMWLGSLLPLWISVLALPPARAASVCYRFSPVGLACVLVLAGTGIVQAITLIATLPALVGTQYGHIALLKTGLFLLALALAAVNRLWLTERLGPGEGRRHLLISVGIETIIGFTIITVAAFLASTVPGAHDTPVWPFTWQFSLVTLREAPEFRQEVLISFLIIGGGVLLMAAALLYRRLVILALILLVAAIAWRGPSFSLLVIEAYPTTFQTSPTGFSAASIAHGQALFAQNCVVCHGPEGDGNGSAAVGLRIRPADLTQSHILEHTDGEMYWFMTHGVDDPEGGRAMPGFAAALSPEDRWALIDYVRAHSAGVAIQQDTAFDTPVRTPAFSIVCNGVGAAAMADLMGRAVVVFLGDTPAAVPTRDAVTLLVPERDLKPRPDTCVATDPAAWNAFAVLADLPLDEAAGSVFLIDPNGWMRAVQRPSATNGWHSRDDLLAAIRGICAHPIEQSSGASHEHHH